VHARDRSRTRKFASAISSGASSVAQARGCSSKFATLDRARKLGPDRRHARSNPPELGRGFGRGRYRSDESRVRDPARYGRFSERAIFLPDHSRDRMLRVYDSGMKPTYEVKFEGLLRLCRDAKKSGIDHVVVHHPEVLGDDYAEIVESLNRIADANLRLQILPRTDRA
jgi:hypothetical protein